MIGLIMLMAASTGFDGNALYGQCRSRGVDQIGCMSYIDGVADGVTMMMPHSAICLPDGITRGRLQDLVTAFLQGHPDRRKEAASLLVMQALHEAYPCSN